MTPFEAYKEYVAIRNHFTLKSYDYFKYGGKTKLTYSSYNKRTDKWIFEKLSDMGDDLTMYLVANFLNNQSFWLGDFEHGKMVFAKFSKEYQSLKYNFQTDITKLTDHTIKQLIDADKELPLIFYKYLDGTISLNSLVLFVDAVGCYSYWKKNIKDDIIWDHYSILIKKYRPFLQVDKKEYLAIIKAAVFSCNEKV